MSLPPHKKEIKALVSLLEEDWETPEELAKALIKALDEARAQRTTYVSVMQFGSGKLTYYLGMGPYAGKGTARKAIEKFPGASLAYRIAIVPMMNDEGVAELMKEVG